MNGKTAEQKREEALDQVTRFEVGARMEAVKAWQERVDAEFEYNCAKHKEDAAMVIWNKAKIDLKKVQEGGILFTDDAIAGEGEG